MPPSVAVIFGIVLIDLIGFGIVIPILPLYADRFGASPLVIGLLLGSYSAMQCVAAPLLGRLSDRIGRRPVLLVSIAGTAAGLLLMGLAQSLWLLFLARILDGITGGNISTAQAYLADITPPERRSARMGLIGAAFGLGLVIGPVLGGVLSHWSLSAPFLFAAALAAANTAAVAVFLPESLPAARRHTPAAQTVVVPVLRQHPSMPMILATYTCTTVAFSLLTATYPLFTRQRFGYGAAENAYIFAGLGLLGALVQGGLLGWLLRLATDKAVTLAGAVLLAGCLFALPLADAPAALYAATAGIGVGHGLIAAPLTGLASRRVSEAAQGRVLGLLQSGASFARIVGPVLGGLLLQFGPSPRFGLSAYWTAGAIMSVAGLLALAL